MRSNSVCKWLMGVSVALAINAAGSTVLAQSGQGLVERFKQLDKNQDGKVTKDELPQVALFKRLDLNGDGAITREEAVKALAGGAAATPADSPMLKKPAATTDGNVAATPLRQGPQPRKPGEHGVGRLVPDASFTDLQGATHKLSEFTKQRAIVMAMTSTSCPISKKYLPTLVELVKASGGDVAWVLVNPVTTDKTVEMQTAAQPFEGMALYVHDRDGALAQSVGALTTTDVVVIDAARTVTYHGAIDDQYGFGYSIDAPRYRYLADALSALAVGTQPLVAATEAPGCALDRPSAAPAKIEVTYHNRISRIVQQHCLECHRDGGVAPFSLVSFDDVVAHAGMVKQVVDRGIMPPWFAADSSGKGGAESPHTSWANDRSLATAEKQDLLDWIAGGQPHGDRRDAPQPRVFADGWLIGKPDAVFEFAKPVAIKATGTMPYQNIVVETHLAEDRWVQAIEVQPGDRGVVHHVLVFVQGSDDKDDGPQDDATEGRDGFWGIYVPGQSTLVYPDGFAKRIPQGAKLRFQMHYTPNGTATTDKSRIGLIFTKAPPQHEVKVAGIVNARISIPAGAENHAEEATLRLPFDVQVLGFLPHMHLRAKACRYEVTKNGQTSTLLDIPRYDFNWQLLYRYFEPLALQQGDAIKFTVWYDNSKNNPANPDPTKTVRWGPQTFDEMHLGYVEYFVPGAKPGETPSLNGGRGLAARGAGGRGFFNLEAIFKRLDRNGDGKLIGDEIPEAQQENLMRLDTNKDGAITLEEAKRLTGRP